MMLPGFPQGRRGRGENSGVIATSSVAFTGVMVLGLLLMKVVVALQSLGSVLPPGF